jgi:ubiquinone/menaquinone biosynthesis C-methylase UbiE
MSIFKRLKLVDPFSQETLRVRSLLDHPKYSRPWYGFLEVTESKVAYPIIEGIARIYAPLSKEHSEWLEETDKKMAESDVGLFQHSETVDSFGFQWTWDDTPRSSEDLLWRVAGRFGIDLNELAGKLVLDAGCGAGDQSHWLLNHGADVVSVDLSKAINVTGKKLCGYNNWVGIQGDVMALPFESATFDFIYCEGVIQHTSDSAKTVSELGRVLKPGGRLAATHYTKPAKWYQKIKHGLNQSLRSRLSRWNPYSLLAFTAFLSALAYVPVMGYVLRKMGIVVFNPRMPTYKATWSCNYDSYGSHTYQRYISHTEFLGYFKRAGCFRTLFASTSECVVYLEKVE